MKNQKAVRAWTRQDARVWDVLQRTGIYTVTEEAVRAKNGAISDFYLELYRWYTHRCRTRLFIPEELEFPIWLALTEDTRLPPARGTVSLTLDIPREHLFIVDYDKWGYRVNDWYVPLDAADEVRHNAELRRWGIGNEAQLILGEQGNYYPQLRQKILRSWERIFTAPSPDPSCNVGTVWALKAEWVKAVSRDGI